ncbi:MULTISPECIES: hypothetical protein [unclassified Streptomyces]|uniref:hypothetical protein n=1 Tax=unclassified Streptomyces TaxID=2593676 RepID=UPI0037FC852A
MDAPREPSRGRRPQCTVWGFLLLLALVFGGSYALGSAVGPLGPVVGPLGPGPPPSSHGGGDGREQREGHDAREHRGDHR